MKKSLQACGLILLATAFLSACEVSVGGSDNNNGGNGEKNINNRPQPTKRINWSAVPSEFNPRTEDISFQTDGFEKLKIDAFGFKDDVEIIYSSEIPANTGFIRIFKVWNKYAYWGEIKPRPNGTTLDLKGNGTYQCSISIHNGQISALEGGCYVGLQIFLPAGAEVEVYNVGELISKRFIPIDAETFLEEFNDATWAEDKFVVIENYLASYSGTSKRPSLTSQQLGTVIGDFIRTEEKFRALRRLHSIVGDRQNLNSMIEDEFSYYEREEARRVVGL